MFNFLLLPVADLARMPSEIAGLEHAPGELTAEQMHNLSRLLTQQVRIAEALVAYAVVIAGRPRVN